MADRRIFRDGRQVIKDKRNAETVVIGGRGRDKQAGHRKPEGSTGDGKGRWRLAHRAAIESGI
jgi:hypothetical protein